MISESVSRKHLKVPAETRQLKRVRDAVQELAGDVLGKKKAHLAMLAVDEALANAILHGGAIDIEVDIEARTATHGGFLEVKIVNGGPAYDVSHAPAADPKERALHGQRGGMGVGIIRKIMDEIHYERLKDSRNELRLIKYAAER